MSLRAFAKGLYHSCTWWISAFKLRANNALERFIPCWYEGIMGGSEVFTLDGVADVLVEHSTRARRISISVRPGSVRVAVPLGVSLAQGRKFALSKKDWIRCHCSRMDLIARARSDAAGNLPLIMDFAEARNKIVARLDDLSDRYCLPYASVTIRNQKTRWGSCSMRNTISLNINLARLPERLMDYVIIHELLHTKIRGHGKGFWQRLDMLVGDARGLRKELTKYSLALI
jgi:predicted metal-dependent hydrolase